MANKHRKGREPPRDTASFRTFIISLNNSIENLARHIAEDRHYLDVAARRKLEQLTALRQRALDEPPPSVDSAVVAELKGAIRDQRE